MWVRLPPQRWGYSFILAAAHSYIKSPCSATDSWVSPGSTTALPNRDECAPAALPPSMSSRGLSLEVILTLVLMLADKLGNYVPEAP